MIGHPCTAAEVRQGRAGEKGRGTGGWVGGEHWKHRGGAQGRAGGGIRRGCKTRIEGGGGGGGEEGPASMVCLFSIFRPLNKEHTMNALTATHPVLYQSHPNYTPVT